MTYEIIPPSKDLEAFVSHFWAARLKAGEQSGFVYYSTANTLTELAFAFKPYNANHSELVFSSVQGHTPGFGQFATGNFVDIMGASLYSYAVPLLLDVSAPEFTNQFTDLHTLLGRKGRMIDEKMAKAMSIPDRVNVLSGYFRSQLRKRKLEDPLITKGLDHIRKHSGLVNIRQLASACCLSQKQFERRFKACSGFTPKLYSRVIRFESALWNCRKYSTLTEAAYAFGYYDQAHFIHDFKTFAGFSPNKFFQLAGY